MTGTKRSVVLWVFIIALGVAWIMLAPSEGFALVSFKSLGIDQKTMEVTEPSRLKEMGMKNVRKGDRIAVTGTEDKRFQILNQRTGEKLVYPPVQEGAPRGTKRPGGSR